MAKHEDLHSPHKSMDKFDCNHNVPCKEEGRTTLKAPTFAEHDTVDSRTGKVEVGLTPVHGGDVPANPFASIAQEGFLHAHPEKLGAKGLKEWDAETKGKHLPEHVKKSK